MARQMLMDNVYLTYIPSEKFKTSFFSAQLVMPLQKETAGLNALLVNVLSRGTLRFPDMRSLSAQLDRLYGARLEPTVLKKGENQVFGFVASCVDERFIPDGERLLEPMADLLGELFLSPATRNGRLRGDYVESERANLADLIRSDINDKRIYAARRLLEVMCEGEPYGLSRLGTAKEVERISLQRLNSHYQAILPAARLELFYCGAAQEKRVAGAFIRAFAALPRQGAVEPAATGPQSGAGGVPGGGGDDGCEPGQAGHRLSHGQPGYACHYGHERHVRRHQQLQALPECPGEALTVLLRRQHLSPCQGPCDGVLRHRGGQL